jgi:hypothetical protein
MSAAPVPVGDGSGAGPFSSIGTAFNEILMAEDIMPGASPSYQTCKLIYEFHPLGAKMVEKPVRIAMSQERDIVVPDGPADECQKAFLQEWVKMSCERAIFSCRVQSKVYGICSLATMVKGEDNEKPLDIDKLWKQEIRLMVFDPLNTAGSLVLEQDPRSFDFQHAQEITVAGSTFHRSKARVVMNEFPIYISYTPSAYGFTGRSVYQRSLYPLKSFIQTMVTNDMISVKAGTIIAKFKQAGSIITNTMLAMFNIKRGVIKMARTGQVVSMGTEESVESIDLKNISEPFGLARKNIVEDIAAGAPMPAQMLTDESFAQGFADGTEDAKEQARYINSERKAMQPLYDFLDPIVMRRAWNPDWYKDIQARYPDDYKKLDYDAAFYKFKNSFSATWPELLQEPESDRILIAETKLKALIAMFQVFLPKLDDDNLVIMAQWVQDNINEMRDLFGNPLELNMDTLENASDPGLDVHGEPLEPVKKQHPWSAADSATDAIVMLSEAAANLRRLKSDRKMRLEDRRSQKS